MLVFDADPLDEPGALAPIFDEGAFHVRCACIACRGKQKRVCAGPVC